MTMGTVPDVDADDELRAAWRSIAGPHHDDVAERLVQRHREVHRRYHTADHVAAVVHHVQQLAGDHPDATIVAAALFHDAIYDPRSSTNEADSARLATDELSTVGWEPDRCEAVRRLVIATAGHEATRADEAILLDADLAILGAAPAHYGAYATAVRAEYAHVSDEAWTLGRATVLRSFLVRPAIFATASMRASRDAQARQNLRCELGTLTRAD